MPAACWPVGSSMIASSSVAFRNPAPTCQIRSAEAPLILRTPNLTLNWFRSYGKNNWEFNGGGFMARRLASINDPPIRDRLPTSIEYF